MGLSDHLAILLVGFGMLSFIAAFHALALGAPLSKVTGLLGAGGIWLIMGWLKLATFIK